MADHKGAAAGAGAGAAGAESWQLSMVPGVGKPLVRGSGNIIVVVTGASGFIGGHIIKLLLEHTDYHVRGTVRSRGGAANAYLHDWVKEYSNRFTLVDGCDLLKAGSFDDAIRGAQFVIHTASGVALTATDKKRDIIDPAILGTRTILEACAKSGGTVQRMVMTSSVAAVAGDDAGSKTLNEKDWNTTCSETHDHYGFSKVESEKLCWKYVAELPADQRFDMVVINPTFVCGPLVSVKQPLNNMGLIAISRFLNRKLPAVPRFKWGMVDVRDVARAHVVALTSANSVGQRYIVTTKAYWFQQVSQSLAASFPAYNPPTSLLPDWVMWALVLSGAEKQIDADGLKVRLGRGVEYDNTKLRTDLKAEGMNELIDIDLSLRDTGASLIAAGYVKPGMGMGTKLMLAGAAVAAAVAYWWLGRSTGTAAAAGK